jgi:TolA-binding protein
MSASILAVAVALNGAPLQCGHGGSDVKHEDDGGDALWSLAMDFRAKGNEEAAKQTLRYLVDKYPSNRHVPAAREELEGAPDAGK